MNDVQHIIQEYQEIRRGYQGVARCYKWMSVALVLAGVLYVAVLVVGVFFVTG